MQIKTAEHAGFCPGVRRADKEIRRLLRRRSPDETLYTLGELIHNRLYNEWLTSEGVRCVSPEELTDAVHREPHRRHTVVLRTHGVTKETYEALDALATSYPSFRYIDMTCPSVLKVHQIAKDHTDEQTVFFIYSDPNHPETVGTLSFAEGEKYAFSSLEEIKNMDIGEKKAIFCAQTTQNLAQFKKIKKFFKNLYTNAIFFDTICNVTENRQTEVVALAKTCDTVLIIGGQHSSNTKKLFDVCQPLCENTYLIESAKDLPSSLCRNGTIGITAGASTPDDIITEVIKAMESNVNEFGTMLEESLTTLHTGETVTGTVYAVTANEIFLDLGAKFTGVITKEQITDDTAASLPAMFKAGDEVTAFVIRVEDGKGVATLSKKRVDADQSWLVFKAAKENGDILEGKVSAVVKGGITMNVSGNRVFVPASQTGIAKDGDLSVLAGTTQKIKIIEFDESKRKAIGSIKVVLGEEKRAREDAVWATLAIDQHFRGTVKNLTPYGAFVDIGGVDGMIHNSELSWKRIKHPSQVVSVGQEVEVFIKDLDPEKRRISLGYKTQEMDTWYQFTQKFAVGDVVPAKIVSIMPFGAFAEVYEDVDGLIHISRISSQRINSPADVLSVGQVVDVKIVEIDDENRRLALSIRALTEEAERAAAEAERAAAAEARAAERAARDAERAEEKKRLEEERADMAPYIVGSID